MQYIYKPMMDKEKAEGLYESLYFLFLCLSCSHFSLSFSLSFRVDDFFRRIDSFRPKISNKPVDFLAWLQRAEHYKPPPESEKPIKERRAPRTTSSETAANEDGNARLVSVVDDAEGDENDNEVEAYDDDDNEDGDE
jgi:hypothetical protein